MKSRRPADRSANNPPDWKLLIAPVLLRETGRHLLGFTLFATTATDSAIWTLNIHPSLRFATGQYRITDFLGFQSFAKRGACRLAIGQANKKISHLGNETMFVTEA